MCKNCPGRFGRSNGPSDFLLLGYHRIISSFHSFELFNSRKTVAAVSQLRLTFLPRTRCLTDSKFGGFIKVLLLDSFSLEGYYFATCPRDHGFYMRLGAVLTTHPVLVNIFLIQSNFPSLLSSLLLFIPFLVSLFLSSSSFPLTVDVSSRQLETALLRLRPPPRYDD